MPPCIIKKLKRVCRLCLMKRERYKSYELFVKSEVECDDALEKDASNDAENVSQQNAFANLILYEKVEYCCGIRLAPKAELPSKICGKCFNSIHMWFNFRQMSCRSQVILSSQENIKLEDNAIAKNTLELQEMRNKLTGDDLITPDNLKPMYEKLTYSIEKEEDEDDDCTTCENLNTSHNDQKEADDCSSKSESENESSLFSQGKNKYCSIPPQEKGMNCSNEEEEEDCLAEICVEEEILRNALIAESLASTESSRHLKQNKKKNSKKIYEDEDVNSAISKEGSQEIQSSTEASQPIRKYSNICESDISDGKEYENNSQQSQDTYKDDNNEDVPTFEPLNSTSKTKSSFKNDGHNRAFQSHINYLLADDNDDNSNKDRKTKNKKTISAQRKRQSNKSLLNDKDALPSEENSLDCKSTEANEARNFMCSVCGNVYTNYLLLSRHVRMHSKERPYKCEICGRAFRTPAYVKRHMAVHTRDKRFRCKYCNLSYTEASSRRRHERSHLESPQYKCVICGKAFIYKTVLRRHIKLHSGEKDYSCAVCDISFSLPHHLKNHIKSMGHIEKQKSYEALGFKIVFETRETMDTQ